MGTVREVSVMSRYIDADNLHNAKFQNTDGYGENVAYRLGWNEAIEAIEENEPTAIDIVRCKECRYCKRKRGTFKGEPIIFYRCEEHNRDVENDDYCSYGEREGER